MQRRLFIGTVDDIFRDEEQQSEMHDADDEYLNLAAEKFEKNYLLDDNDDDYLVLAAQNYEKSVQKMNVPRQPLPNSMKEINKNRLQAKIRLRKKQISTTFCNFLADSFFHAEEWPTYAQEIILAEQFDYQQRCALAAFFTGNGLVDGEVAEKIYKIWNLHWSNSLQWNKRFSEFRNIFKYYDKAINDPDRARIRATYFYYDMRTNRNLYLNGKVFKK